ncbi:hypothetical protein B4N89_27900 [Embleya scabrispora]|uniref:DUF3168 domain-containing protein n=1 Tax=Embleya scabrispora TaxID=159449 RepID=A0A1T3P5A6_9ACTN|nr:hypothetical protein [Embleya scabrispora]OPC84243.1 hypothetical protein B4N89_27900 [Embleya scabrispora]
MDAFVDIEVLLIAWLSAGRPGTTWAAELDNDLLSYLPCGQVVRVGGDDDGTRLDRALVDVDIYAAGRAQAADIAAWTRTALTRNLPGSSLPGAVVGRVSTVSAPAWRPYENTALRRMGATYEVFLHPAVT